MNVKLKVVHALSVGRSVFVHMALGGASLLKMAVSRFFYILYVKVKQAAEINVI